MRLTLINDGWNPFSEPKVERSPRTDSTDRIIRADPDIKDFKWLLVSGPRPWDSFLVRSANVKGREALIAVAGGYVNTKSKYLHYYYNSFIDPVDRFFSVCEKLQKHPYICGIATKPVYENGLMKSHDFHHIKGHFPLDMRGFMKEYIDKKLDGKCGGLTWRVFGEIIGENGKVQNERNIFKE